MESIGLKAILDDANFQAGLKRYLSGLGEANTKTTQSASTLSRLGRVASGALVVGLGAATLAAGVFTAATKLGLDAAVAWGGTLDQLGDQFGLVGANASKWAEAFSHVGLSVEEGAQGLNFFTRGLAETVKIGKDGTTTLTPFGESLKKLGVSAYDSKGRLKDFNTIMPEIMDRFKKLPPGINASALAMDLFGARGGSKFLDFLKQGSQGLEEARKKAHAFGLDLSTDQVDAIEEFGFALNDLNDGVKGFWTQIGVHVLPLARRLVDFIGTRVLPVLVQWARENMPRVTRALQDFVGVLQRDVFPVLGRAWGAVQGFVQAFQRGGIGGVFDELGRQLGNAFKGFDLAKTLGDIGGKLAQALRDNWPPVRDELAKWGTRFWNWLTAKDGALDQAGTQLGKVKDAIVDWASKNGPEAWDLIGKWASTFWNWITDPNKGLLITISDNMAKLTESIKKWSEDPETQTQFENIGKTLAQDILNGIGKWFESSEGQDESLLLKLIRNIAQAISNLGQALLNLGGDIATVIVKGIASTFASPLMSDLAGRAMKAFFANLYKNLVEQGTIMGFVQSIADLLGAELTSAISNFMGGGSILSGTGGRGGGAAGGSSFASGGPVWQTGQALVHAGEYVLNRQQAMMLAPVLAGANNSRTFNFTHNWPAAVRESDRQWTEQMVRTVTHEEIANILDKA